MIAPDTTASLGFTTGTSLTVAFNNAGGNILFVGVNNGGGAQNITGVTYAGVAMTQVTGSPVQIPADSYIYLFYLVNPATGNNNVVISADSSVYIGGAAVSYKGNLSGIDTSGNTTATGAGSIAKSLTPTVNNTWAIAWVRCKTNDLVAGANTTLRQAGEQTQDSFFDSNAPINPIGSRTLTVTLNADNAAMIMALFGGGEVSSYAFFM